MGSLPCALWCFLASPEDFEKTLFTAVDAGHDADTVAAMACPVAGAYHGHSHLPQRLLPELEYHDHLLGLADGLYELNRRPYGLPEGGGQYSDLTRVSVRRTIGRTRQENSSSGVGPQSFENGAMGDVAPAGHCDEN